jgi:hypothetical protein
MSWFYFSNSERRFMPFSPELSATIEAAYARGNPIGVFAVEDKKFEVHFEMVCEYKS